MCTHNTSVAIGQRLHRLESLGVTHQIQYKSFRSNRPGGRKSTRRLKTFMTPWDVTIFRLITTSLCLLPDIPFVPRSTRRLSHLPSGPECLSQETNTLLWTRRDGSCGDPFPTGLPCQVLWVGIYAGARAGPDRLLKKSRNVGKHLSCLSFVSWFHPGRAPRSARGRTPHNSFGLPTTNGTLPPNGANEGEWIRKVNKVPGRKSNGA